MRRSRKQRNHLDLLNGEKRREELEDKLTTEAALHFAIAMIYNGFLETSASRFCLMTGLTKPSNKKILAAINRIRPILKEMAENNVRECFAQMPPGAVISVDGSWDHRRHAHVHIFDVICIQKHKIVAFDILMQDTENRMGNTDVDGHAMEGEAFLHILPQLMNNPKIVEIVKDGDVHIEHLILSHEWKVTIRQDPNHFLKHFQTTFNQIIAKQNKPDLKNHFRGICTFMHENLVNILYQHRSEQDRFEAINRMKTHILEEPFLKSGGHLHKWKSADNPDCLKCLDDLRTECKKIAQKLVIGHITNYNEGYHSLKAMFVPKEFYLGNTTDVRLYASILQFNEPDFWLFRLYEELHLPNDRVQLLLEFNQHRKRAGIGRDTHALFLEFMRQRRQKNANAEEDRIRRDANIANNIPMHW